MSTVNKNITVYKWFQKVTDIKQGESAVLNGNYVVFYGIHFAAINTIIVSLVSCLIVITSILRNSVITRWDFSDRFPLYLAIAEVLWGISHLIDHVILLSTQIYPESSLSVALSVNLTFFVGYQQLMNAGLAGYIYLKIVQGVSLDLGKAEWRLHFCCLILLIISLAIFYPLGSFGCSGYWFLQDAKTGAGLALGIYEASFLTAQALFTTFSYRSIRTTVNSQKDIFQNDTKPQKHSHHTTATRCLSTFVKTSLYLYCPLSIAYWLFVFQTWLGFIEPLTALFIVIVANSSGWINAFGYFHNKQVKAQRNKNRFRNHLTFSSSPNMLSTVLDRNFD